MAHSLNGPVDATFNTYLSLARLQVESEEKYSANQKSRLVRKSSVARLHDVAPQS